MVDRRLLAVAAVTVLGPGALWPPPDRPPEKPAIAAPLAVRAVTVAAGSGSAISVPRFAATIHYEREADLSFRVPGQIARLPVRPGDRIAAGALIAVITPTAYSAAAASRDADAVRTARDAARIAGLVGDGAISPAAAADERDLANASAAALAAAHYDLASTRLRAPYAALVMARTAQVGQTVAPGQVVVRVADRLSPMLAIVDVPAQIATHLIRGSSALVWPDGAGQQVAAQVWRVPGGADPKSGLVGVEVRLATPLELASGSPVAVGFVAPATAVAGDVRQRIPAAALIDAKDALATVWVIDRGGHARRQSVRFFGFDDTDALVDGLSAGSRVITAGAGFVSEGQAVTVIGA